MRVLDSLLETAQAPPTIGPHEAINCQSEHNTCDSAGNLRASVVSFRTVRPCAIIRHHALGAHTPNPHKAAISRFPRGHSFKRATCSYKKLGTFGNLTKLLWESDQAPVLSRGCGLEANKALHIWCVT